VDGHAVLYDSLAIILVFCLFFHFKIFNVSSSLLVFLYRIFCSNACSIWKISILTILCSLVIFLREQSISRYTYIPFLQDETDDNNVIPFYSILKERESGEFRNLMRAFSSDVLIRRLLVLFPQQYNLFRT